MNLPDSDSEDELPTGWEERATNDGSVFYVNHITKDTQWIHPRTGRKKFVSGELPYGWEKCIDEETGKIYYVDHENHRTTYTDPRLAFATEEKKHPYDFRQKFDASSTSLQVLHGRDLTGITALITGCNTGIGFETARSLAKHGCNVIFACRNLSAANEAIEKITTEKLDAGKRCEAIRLNLSSLHDTKMFAETVREKYRTLDILILNAGVFGLSYTTTIDGYETIFQVNHLSQFYLTLLLSPILKKGSRVVVVSSESHRFSNVSLRSPLAATLSPSYHNFWSMMAYNNSKLCNILFAKELSNKWKSRGISVFVLHPGNLISSDISRHWWFWKLLFAIVRPFTKSLQQASSTSVYCATAPELTGTTGLYFNNCCICDASASAKDEQLANAVWEVSEEMVKSVIGADAFTAS